MVQDNDPQFSNAPIVKRTLCTMGNHTFIFGGIFSSDVPDNWRCTCGCYTRSQWRDICSAEINKNENS